jgi:hypothetical protein
MFLLQFYLLRVLLNVNDMLQVVMMGLTQWPIGSMEIRMMTLMLTLLMLLPQWLGVISTTSFLSSPSINICVNTYFLIHIPPCVYSGCFYYSISREQLKRLNMVRSCMALPKKMETLQILLP